jgi:hypothetical protein
MRYNTPSFSNETNRSLGRRHRLAPCLRGKEGTENQISFLPIRPRTNARQWCSEWSARVEPVAQEQRTLAASNEKE